MHCYQSSHKKNSYEANLFEKKTMADSIFNSLAGESSSVSLTGGEPMLLEDLSELVEHISSYNNLKQIHIITNGTVTDHKLLKKLSSFKKLTSFKISIESGDETINDTVRGKGSHSQIAKSVTLYKQATGRTISMMVTLSKLNFASIPQTIEFAKSIMADSVIFERFVPLGTGLAMAESVLTADDWHDSIKLICQSSKVNLSPYELAACRGFRLMLNPDIEPEDRLEAALCDLGPHSMALMPDGTVFPCRRLQINVGNVLNMPFDTIRSRLSDFDCKKIKPKILGNVCGVCPIDNCPGCRAIAKALSNEFLADDLQCVFNRKGK